MKTFATVLLLCLSAQAIDKKELFFDLGQMGASAADAYETEQCRQHRSFRELDPIARPFMGSRGGLVVFFATGTTGTILLGHWLHRHGHNRLELVERSTGIIGNGGSAIFDSRQLANVAKGQ